MVLPRDHGNEPRPRHGRRRQPRPSPVASATRYAGNARNPLIDNMFDTERRLEEMDRLNIDMQVLSLTSPGVQLLGPVDAVRMASVANDKLARIASDHPTRFGGLASFAPQDPAAAAREMERASTISAYMASSSIRTPTTSTSTIRALARSSRRPRRSTGRFTSIRAALRTGWPARSATTGCGQRSGASQSRPARTPCG